jgi:hypothetical protein
MIVHEISVTRIALPGVRDFVLVYPMAALVLGVT